MNTPMNTDKLIELRQKRGLTQTDLADQLGCQQQVVSRWESGINSPRILTILRISEILGCSLDDLIKKNRS